MSYYKTGGKVSWQGYWQEMLGYDTNNTRNQCKTKGGVYQAQKLLHRKINDLQNEGQCTKLENILKIAHLI